MTPCKEVAEMIGEISSILKEKGFDEELRARIFELCIMLSTLSYDSGQTDFAKTIYEKFIEKENPAVN